MVNHWLCLWPASNFLIFANWTLYSSSRLNCCFFLTASRFTKVTFRLSVFPKTPPPFLSSQATLHDFVVRQVLLSILLLSFLTQVHVIGNKSQPRNSTQVVIRTTPIKSATKIVTQGNANETGSARSKPRSQSYKRGRQLSLFSRPLTEY